MSQIQDLTRSLLAAGGTAHPEGKGAYFLYSERASLVSKHWTGSAFGDGELITDNVRSDSTAAYLISPSSRLVVCISSSSTLRLLRYDEDDEEWVDDDKFPRLSVHRDGNLSADIDEDGQISVFFQDASGHLVYMNTAGAPIVLPANPVAGSPISALRADGQPVVFYVSAGDSRLHCVTQAANGEWSDQSFMNLTIEDKLKRIAVGGSEKSGPEIFALTGDRRLLQYVVGGEGQRRELGKVNEAGTYVPGTTAEFCIGLDIKLFGHRFSWRVCNEHDRCRCKEPQERKPEWLPKPHHGVFPESQYGMTPGPWPIPPSALRPDWSYGPAHGWEPRCEGAPGETILGQSLPFADERQFAPYRNSSMYHSPPPYR